jgi:anti-sigma regulatory factor (Ser/Thr protein kinase)
LGANGLGAQGRQAREPGARGQEQQDEQQEDERPDERPDQRRPPESGPGQGRPGRRTAYWDLPAAAPSAARARTLAGRALREWNITHPEDVDDIVLMVDELVTNAIVHGRGRVRLRLRLDGAQLTVEVSDDDPAAPTPPRRAPGVLEWAEDGRGLLLVGTLASAFGTRPDGPGKTVWFSRLLLPAARTPEPAPARTPERAPGRPAAGDRPAGRPGTVAGPPPGARPIPSP